MAFVEVDGSQGEGGGQILRTAVAFSAIKRVPVRVVKIRAGREVPGLKRQHLSALLTLARIFGGELSGAEEGSSAVSFVPGKPRLQELAIDMGTAASITLVLQAVVPAVSLSGSKLSLGLTGGTDVPWSPTFDYFQRVVREGYRSMGIKVDVTSSRRGYYPRGGGRVTASIEPCESVLPLDMTSRSEVTGVRLLSRCAKLPRGVAERQMASASEIISRSGMHIEAADVSEEQADSPGSSILAYSVGAHALLGSDAIGAKGKPAEEVGREAASRFVAMARSGGCLDSNLADMLVPLLALAPGPSRVRVPEVTPHLQSGLHLAEQFVQFEWSVESEGGSALVTLRPKGT
ncbi:MAG: RNA 3'-terminal phosphate cyclase [Thaumarchaeota archaeon]|nr:RNA 3'-terminal phosphate cyclase [Nitrososphaerota archaeon]